ncbi:MAG TPA: hypothetical protein VF786_07635, partial [Terriglobales bacterium]
MLVGAAAAQVISPAEIKDPELRSLQKEYLDQLRYVGNEVHAHNFDHPFYFSRRLDIDEQKQQRTDQRSVRFDKFKDETVLAVTGNYYAAYPARMDGNERARHTFEEVVLPILKAEVSQFEKNSKVQGYAFEVSHHVIGKVMDVTMERPENVEFFIPQPAAQRLVLAKNETEEQAALLDSQVFLNTEPTTLWVRKDVAEPETLKHPAAAPTAHDTGQAEKKVGSGFAPALNIATPARDTSPEALNALQIANQPTLDKIVSELDSQAHFVSYAPPKFVAFRQGIYLETSLTTTLTAAPGSRYKQAALAFDDHISHLIRPILAYFKSDSSFDGIAFSTSLRTGTEKDATSSEAVEFFLPFAA